MMTHIVTAPSEILRQVAKPVISLDPRVIKVIKNMESTLKTAKSPSGVGLAAPQIGQSLRLFMIRPEPHGPITVFINPEIIRYSQRTTDPNSKHGIYEGCLSFPLYYAPLKRSTSVTVKYQSPQMINGQWQMTNKTGVFSGFPAHVIQHEMDHLNGLLFIDRVLEQHVKLYRAVGKDWEEISL